MNATTVSVNGRDYRRPRRPVVVVFIDGLPCANTLDKGSDILAARSVTIENGSYSAFLGILSGFVRATDCATLAGLHARR